MVDERDEVAPALSAPTVRNIPVEMQELADRGFTGTFRVVADARVVCDRGHHVHEAAELEIVDVRRLEGRSDPADMSAVIALRCRNCQQAGTLVLTYGPSASAEDADVLVALDDHEWIKASRDAEEEAGNPGEPAPPPTRDRRGDSRGIDSGRAVRRAARLTLGLHLLVRDELLHRDLERLRGGAERLRDELHAAAGLLLDLLEEVLLGDGLAERASAAGPATTTASTTRALQSARHGVGDGAGEDVGDVVGECFNSGLKLSLDSLIHGRAISERQRMR
jgi:hypothetical protein